MAFRCCLDHMESMSSSSTERILLLKKESALNLSAALQKKKISALVSAVTPPKSCKTPTQKPHDVWDDRSLESSKHGPFHDYRFTVVFAIGRLRKKIHTVDGDEYYCVIYFPPSGEYSGY